MPKEHAATTAGATKHKGLRVVGVVNFRMNKGAAEARLLRAKAMVLWPHCYEADKIKNPFESAHRTPRTPLFYLLDRGGNVERFAYQWSVMSVILGEQSR